MVRHLRLVALLVALVAASCSNGGGEPAATPSETTTSSSRPDSAVILAAYDGFMASIPAAREADADPAVVLGEFATGDQLERSLELALSDRAEGRAIRLGEPPSEHHARVVEATATVAVVEDCWRDTDVIYDVESGEALDDSQVWTRAEVVLVFEDGSWKVERSDIRALGEGASCADAA